MFVERIINSIFTSNTYICYFEEENAVWVVDPGDSEPVVQWLCANNKILKGLLITHAHFDHIYGINDLYKVYPAIKIYASHFAREGMLSSRLNGSYYMETPFVIDSKPIHIVEDKDTIDLAANIYANVMYTPGHNNDCLSFEIKQFLFTGDALIPGIKIHTKSKFGNKALVRKSIENIIHKFDPDTIICPGHGDMCLLEDIIISDLFDLKR